jgi:hypothetical protein
VAGRTALARHPLAVAGALLTTVSAVVFIALVIAVLFGLFQHPYAGLVVFVVVPGLFVLGLLLIPFGKWLEARRLPGSSMSGSPLALDKRSARIISRTTTTMPRT